MDSQERIYTAGNERKHMTHIEALNLALDLATMHHTDAGYAELRAKVRVAIKEAQPQQEQPAQQERPSFAEWTSDYVQDNLHKLNPQPAQQDIPDLIAGTLGVSRGTAYDMMREALAQPPVAKPYEQEPAACGWWEHTSPVTGIKDVQDWQLTEADKASGWIEQPLYTTPPQRKPLTDEEITEVWRELKSKNEAWSDLDFARAIEAAHGIKE